MAIYDHKRIEEKWREVWAEKRLYQPDLKKAEKPYYNLMMFPYPSAEGLHVGNMYAFTGSDVWGRYQRMLGHDVFEPIGLDGFGIHSENYAIKVGRHPKEHAKISQAHFYKQLEQIGNGFAWENRLETYDPEYYRWTQWLFIELFKKGLAYRGKATVNWCPSCKTVLADEQVEDGVCERCKTVVVKKEMTSWYFKITAYAERLLNNLDKLDWPKKIVTAQRNWIGRKEGVLIDHKVKGLDITLTAFSAYPAWLFADTFLVIAPEHPAAVDLATGTEQEGAVKKFLEKSTALRGEEKLRAKAEKEGVFTGRYVVDPFTGDDMPVWIANFAVMDVGTGVIRCSAHDPRDFEFAQKYGLKLREVVDRTDLEMPVHAHGNQGILKESGPFTGKAISEKLIKDMVDWIEDRNIGKRTVTYHLRDWLISRQRYWGPPIPMVECDKCGWQAVPEEELPVLLPEVKDWKPIGTGKSPLETAANEWLYTKCPKCGGKAKRETDVSDTFLDSAWYFLRYPSIENSKKQIPRNKQITNLKFQNSKSLYLGASNLELPWNPEVTRRWLPVDMYIGGAEHAVLHLLYARFVWMLLKDEGHLPGIDSDEPFPRLFSHGLIIKDGAKMSKSRGNVVTPDEYIDKFGADTLRTYLMFLGPLGQGGDFRDTGIAGMYRFIERVWGVFETGIGEKTTKGFEKRVHQAIKRATEGIERFKYNTAIAALMKLVNDWKRQEIKLSWADAGVVCRLLAPFAPYVAEELWQRLLAEHKCEDQHCWFQKVSSKDWPGRSVHKQWWPRWQESMLQEDKTTIVVQVNGKVRSTLDIRSSIVDRRDEVITMAKEHERVKRWLEGKEIIKEVWVPGKLVNLVVK